MANPQKTVYVFGVYELDTHGYQLRRAGERLQLEPKVFNVLAYLVQHHHCLVTKEELFQHLWPDAFVGDAALVRCIAAARKALGDRQHTRQIIETVRGHGYRFMAPVTLAAPTDARGLRPVPWAPCRRPLPVLDRPPHSVLAWWSSARHGEVACARHEHRRTRSAARWG